MKKPKTFTSQFKQEKATLSNPRVNLSKRGSVLEKMWNMVVKNLLQKSITIFSHKKFFSLLKNNHILMRSL